jgi:hypothetical protein
MAIAKWAGVTFLMVALSVFIINRIPFLKAMVGGSM